MRRLIAIGIVLACAGCATPGETMSKDPVASWKSSKSVQAYVECAIPAVVQGWPLTRSIPKSGGQQIIVSGDGFGNVAAVIDVSADGSGSRVDLKQGAAASWVLKGISKTTESCI